MKRPIDSLNIKDIPWDVAEFNKSEEIKYLLHEIKEEKPYFKGAINKRHMQDVWCVKPLRKNQRLIKQDGYFLLFGIDNHKIFPAKIKRCIKIERWKIDSKNKKNILEQLDLLGISRDKLFPELDETAKYLKEKFKNGKTTSWR